MTGKSGLHRPYMSLLLAKSAPSRWHYSKQEWQTKKRSAFVLTLIL